MTAYHTPPQVYYDHLEINNMLLGLTYSVTLSEEERDTARAAINKSGLPEKNALRNALKMKIRSAIY